MLEVPRILVSVSFQSNDVNGAQYSELLFCNNNKQQKQYTCIAAYHTADHSVLRVKYSQMPNVAIINGISHNYIKPIASFSY